MASNTLNIITIMVQRNRIEYLLVRTRRKKTSEIIVDSDEILLRVPYAKTKGRRKNIKREN
jgi:predicted metal-dependent hydrolase